MLMFLIVSLDLRPALMCSGFFWFLPIHNAPAAHWFRQFEDYRHLALYEFLIDDRITDRIAISKSKFAITPSPQGKVFKESVLLVIK